ncbi:hypothetical protein BX616_002507 [Lobosporangium transversale]|uniref:Galactose oxidase n=1 Tax=Lobosporangium transversale TaxID=64571 RepID=A0A1Y2GP51_9FUNG|nr:hypothetical protein BCR41DRAFT_352576 [Lobosporangium transversale]KAF9916894.1 hypothetical protein BX616_002507 [Lobosporangium transversale]ORZ17481.1 hypothetical protein BCR41DRAFT_352576 [Lobosporangium transversale]|eukprot:XP_021881868.1 hypothetical protein BCR41DRAFT_352576 [Lobosporangium transversale]
MHSRSIYCGCAFLLLSSVSIHAQQQTFQPDVKIGSLNAFVDGRAMYVLGGESGTAPGQANSQAFSIDLSVSWPTNAPVFTKLPDGPSIKGGFHHGASAISSDGRTWFVASSSSSGGNTGYFYNFRTEEWSEISNKQISFEGDKAISFVLGSGAATDPSSGMIYVPNGLVDPTGQRSMLQIEEDNVDRPINSVEMPDALQTTIGAGASTSMMSSTFVAWSAARESMIYLDMSTISTARAFAYNPEKGWSQLEMHGSIPHSRSDACFVAAQGGSKLVLFGGFDSSLQSSLNDIHILDTTTMTWTSGGNSMDNGRMGAACAASGDYFIAWGGQSRLSGNNVLAGTGTSTNTIMVYDMKTQLWTSEYVAPSPVRSKKSTGYILAVIGTVLGSLSVVLAIGACILHRARKMRIQASKDASMDGDDDYALGKYIYVQPGARNGSQVTLQEPPTYAAAALPQPLPPAYQA